MAFVHFITAKDAAYVTQPPPGGVANSVSRTVLVGNPSSVTKLAVIPGSFAAAGSPSANVSLDDKVLIINSDTSIDVAIVRRGHSPSEVVPVPVPVIGGGLSSYVVLLPPNATDIFVRAMA